MFEAVHILPIYIQLVKKNYRKRPFNKLHFIDKNVDIF